MKWKVVMLSGLVLWGVLFTASRVDAAEPVVITEEVEQYSIKYGTQYGISPEIIQAMCWTESRCNPTAQSPNKACKGVAQIHVASHQERMSRLNVRNIFDVAGNIHVACDYLAEISETEPDIGCALMIYNGSSPERVSEGRNGRLSGYAKQVLEIAAELEERNGK